MQRRFNEVSHSYALKFCIHGTYSTILMFSIFICKLNTASGECSCTLIRTLQSQRFKSPSSLHWTHSLTHSLTAAPFNFKTQSIVFPQPSARLRSGPPNLHRFVAPEPTQSLHNQQQKVWIEAGGFPSSPCAFFTDQPTIRMESTTTAPTSRKRRSWSSSSRYPGYKKNWVPICCCNRAS